MNEQTENLAESTHGTGGVMDIYDSRDYQWRDIASASTPFNWAEGFDIEEKLGFKIPVKDQKTSSSCGGQAWAYYAQVLEALHTKTFEERSAKYIYAQTVVPGGGSAGRDNADIFKKQGVAHEAILPSYPATEENLTASEHITNAIRENAKSNISTSYAQTGTDINTVAQAMRDNNGVIIGISGENNGTWLSAFPKPPVNPQWRHWIFAGKAKMINGKQYIGLLNSWGDEVGDKGWQWIGRDYFESQHVWSGWTHILGTVKPSTKPFNVDMKYMQSSDEIKRLQGVLKGLGYFPQYQEETGYYGEITRQAVYMFQVGHVKLTAWEYFVLRGKTCGLKTRTILNNLIK